VGVKNNSGVIQQFFVYNWQNHSSTAVHVPGAQGELQMDATKISMSKDRPDELDEFIYIWPNGGKHMNKNY
jgi:hypothetical protein